MPNRTQGLDPLTRVSSTPAEGQMETISNNEKLKKAIQTNQKNKEYKVYNLKKQKLKI